MRRLFLSIAMVAVAFAAFAQTTGDVLWSMRIWPKLDKIGEIEKKLPLFLKTHYPKLSFRVYETITGPNTGSYVVVSGPYAFKDFDVPMVSPKGEALQRTDDLALLSMYEKTEVQFSRILFDLSIPKPNREIKFIQVTEREYEAGKWDEYLDFLKKLRAAREKGSKLDVSYMEPAMGASNTFTAIRFFNKWEELDNAENLAEMYDNVNGKAAWSEKMKTINVINKSTKREIRVLRKDLGTTAVPAK